VTPWNFPVAIPLWKTAPALAWGNAVLLKPSSAGVAVAHALTELIAAHVPDGLLQCLPGGGALVRRLVELVQGLSFTGSTAVGRQLIRQCAEHAIPCQAEMGGSNPSVVLADADLDRASAAIAASAMAFAGQKCTATSRIIVEAPIYERFRDRLVDQIGTLRVGDPAEETTVSGPVIDQRALDEALGAIEGSTGRILAGGTATGTGYTLRPTLVEAAGSDILLEDEVFAPVAALCRAENAESAFRAAADTRFGLSAGIFTNNLDQALRYVDLAEAGMVRVNAPTTGVDYWAPFGGMKSSSYGTREQGLAARDFYTHGCTVFVDR
jgi:aldehyde dehydrogenase (NAD+)